MPYIEGGKLTRKNIKVLTSCYACGRSLDAANGERLCRNRDCEKYVPAPESVAE